MGNPLFFEQLAREATPDVKDFTLARTDVRFRIGSDIFYCAPDIPFRMVADIGSMASSDVGTSSYEKFLIFLRGIMHPDSAARFQERLDSLEEPIGIQQIKALMPWLLEQYGLRPTEPSSESVSGSGDGDMSSTDSVSPMESTSQG